MFSVMMIPFIMGVCLVLFIWVICQSVENSKKNAEQLNYDNAYQENMLFSSDEKKSYNELKKIADELGYQLLAKIRVFELVKPVQGMINYDMYLDEIKFMYFDFVLCDKDLNVKYIIEMDNENYKRSNYKIRKEFLDKVLYDIGYKVIHVYKIDENLKDKLK